MIKPATFGYLHRKTLMEHPVLPGGGLCGTVSDSGEVMANGMCRREHGVVWNRFFFQSFFSFFFFFFPMETIWKHTKIIHLVGGLEHDWIIVPYILGMIIPTDEVIFFQRG